MGEKRRNQTERWPVPPQLWPRGTAVGRGSTPQQLWNIFSHLLKLKVCHLVFLEVETTLRQQNLGHHTVCTALSYSRPILHLYSSSFGLSPLHGALFPLLWCFSLLWTPWRSVAGPSSLILWLEGSMEQWLHQLVVGQEGSSVWGDLFHEAQGQSTLQTSGTAFLHFTGLAFWLLESHQLLTCNEEARAVLH